MNNLQKNYRRNLAKRVFIGNAKPSKKGGIEAVCFWRGLTGEPCPDYVPKYSIAYAAWRAGRDVKRAKDDFPTTYKGVFIYFEPVYLKYTIDIYGDSEQFRTLKEAKQIISDYKSVE